MKAQLVERVGQLVGSVDLLWLSAALLGVAQRSALTACTRVRWWLLVAGGGWWLMGGGIQIPRLAFCAYAKYINNEC